MEIQPDELCLIDDEPRDKAWSVYYHQKWGEFPNKSLYEKQPDATKVGDELKNASGQILKAGVMGGVTGGGVNPVTAVGAAGSVAAGLALA